MSSPRPPSNVSPARRIFQNASALISGKAFAGVLSLAYLAIAARSLGPTQLGYLVLAHTYVLILSRVARFQSWQAVIRFGTPLLAEGRSETFRTLLRFTVKLDVLSGILAVVVALALLPVAGHLFGWPREARGLITAYCFVAPFMIAATPTGVLRLFDRYKLLGWQIALMPTVRFVGSILVWVLGGGLVGFLLVWLISGVVDGVSLWALGWRELRRQGQLPPLRRPANESAAPEWLPFMIKTNLSSTVDQTQHLLPVLIVGAVLGGAAASFLQLAHNLANLIAQPANMLNHATFPELSRVEAEQGRKAMLALTWRSALSACAIAAPIVLIYLLFGQHLAVLVGGAEFAPAGLLVGLMALTQLWRITSLVLESATLAAGYAGWVLGTQLISALLHVGVLAIFLTSLGVIVAPFAILASWTAIIAGCSLRLRQTSRTSGFASKQP